MTEMNSNAIASIVRGCGKRKPGGVYAEMGLSPWGSPLESFLYDPIPQIDTELFGISAQGVRIYPAELMNVAEHKTFIFDWIGAQPYPNPTDWLEEVRRYGMSQRLELQPEQYRQLSPNSGIVPVHGRAWWPDFERIVFFQNRALDQYPDYHNDWRDWNYCPQYPKHAEPGKWLMELPMCAGLLWESVTGGLPIAEGSRIVNRKMPSFSYEAASAPFETLQHFQPGALGFFPITRIVVVDDMIDGSHEGKLKRLDGCALPVEVVEE